jgi:hypothetical protein
MDDEKIGEGLIRIGSMTKAQVADVLSRQRSGDDRLFGEIAIELGHINDEAIQSYLNIRTGCRYRNDCHFYNIRDMVPSNLRLKELYCEQWPQKCAIYQQRSAGKTLSITLWPTGKLKI